MTTAQTTPNPFALMMDPEPIFAAMACSERLARLTSRVFRPLDKPAIVRAGPAAAEFDEIPEVADTDGAEAADDERGE